MHMGTWNNEISVYQSYIKQSVQAENIISNAAQIKIT